QITTAGLPQEPPQEPPLPQKPVYLACGAWDNVGLRLFVSGDPGGSLYVNSFDASLGTWGTWTVLPAPVYSPQGNLGQTNAYVPPASLLTLWPQFADGWLAAFNVDAWGNLAGIQNDDPFQISEGWTQYTAYSGPASTTYWQVTYQVGLLAVGQLQGYVGQGSSDISGSNRQYLLAFVVEQNSNNIWAVPIYCDDTNDGQTPGQPAFVGASPGAISAIAFGVNADGRLEVFVLESQNQCSHWWQNAAGTQP
ncbi:MAG TPA: hypothetical protein VEN79_06155, partial [Terriglobia bacterium]|nr:hypothetical protein [Terriglobia bacterium]